MKNLSSLIIVLLAFTAICITWFGSLSKELSIAINIGFYLTVILLYMKKDKK